MYPDRRRRATAIKLRIGDINNGELNTEQDGSKALHVRTDDIVKRVRVMGVITEKVVIESDETVLLDIEDNTGTIKVKGGGSEWTSDVYLKMNELKDNQMVDIIGLIREASDGKPYIDCEICILVTDQSLKVLRDLEISKYYKKKGLDSEAINNIEKAIKGQVQLSQSDEIKDQILELLKKDENLEEGCSFDEIKRALALTTKELEP